jgi:hypothetical protein
MYNGVQFVIKSHAAKTLYSEPKSSYSGEEIFLTYKTRSFINVFTKGREFDLTLMHFNVDHIDTFSSETSKFYYSYANH